MGEPANRPEAILGRESTDYDFDVQQILLERTQRELREAKRMIWALTESAGGKLSVRRDVLEDANSKDAVLTQYRNLDRDEIVFETSRRERPAAVE